MTARKDVQPASYWVTMVERVAATRYPDPPGR